jgi:integrase
LLLSKADLTVTKDQVMTFVGCLDDWRYGTAWLVQLTLGLRPGEVLGLTWDELDLDGDAPVLHVRQALREGPSGLTLGATKTPRSARSLALPSITVDALLRHQTRQAMEREKAADMWAAPNLNLVFPTALGHPVNKRNYRDSLLRATKAAGIPGTWAPYELRHTWVSSAATRGRPMGLSLTPLATVPA